MFDVPPMPEPAPPSGDDAASWLIRQPGVPTAIVELVAETAERLSVRSPVGPEDFQRIVSDRLFLARLEALATAVLPW